MNNTTEPNPMAVAHTPTASGDNLTLNPVPKWISDASNENITQRAHATHLHWESEKSRIEAHLMLQEYANRKGQVDEHINARMSKAECHLSALETALVKLQSKFADSQQMSNCAEAKQITR